MIIMFVYFVYEQNTNIIQLYFKTTYEHFSLKL